MVGITPAPAGAGSTPGRYVIEVKETVTAMIAVTAAGPEEAEELFYREYGAGGALDGEIEHQLRRADVESDYSARPYGGPYDGLVPDLSSLVDGTEEKPGGLAGLAAEKESAAAGRVPAPAAPGDREEI